MALVRRSGYWDPFTELTRLQDEMNDLFDVSFGAYPAQANGLLDRSWAPAVDVFESKNDILVKADLPGLSKDEIDITIEHNMLVIKGEKKHDQKVDEENYVRSERFYGVFNRAISLPTDVDASKAKAEYKNGTLELTLPKKEEVKPKQITVNIK